MSSAELAQRVVKVNSHGCSKSEIRQPAVIVDDDFNHINITETFIIQIIMIL